MTPGALQADTTSGIVYQVQANGSLKALYGSLAAATLAASPILQTVDVAAAASGVPLVIDAPYAMTAAYVVTTSVVFLRPQGQISLTTSPYNLTLPTATYGDPYTHAFVQSGVGNGSTAGQVYFAGQTVVSPCWWGADPTGNTNGAAETATQKAFLAAEIAVDGNEDCAHITSNPNYGSIVSPPPGHYILDVSQPNAWIFRNSHHIARPGTVRLDFDPTTVVVRSDDNIGLAGLGNPNNNLRSFQSVTSITGQSTFGARSAASCPVGLIWYGIDMVHAPTNTFLGTNKFLSGLWWNGCQGGVVEDSNFIGMPNDGVAAYFGSVKAINCKAWMNGFYGGSSLGDSTRNGLSLQGWFDIATPSLTSWGNAAINCDVRCNANTGVLGGVSQDFKTIGGVNEGNSTGIEVQAPTTLTAWTQGATVVGGGSTPSVLYVPGTSPSNSPVGLGGSIYLYTTSGTTNSTGTGPTGTGSGIADGSAVCEFIGYMPENGKIPASTMISDQLLEGTLPTSLDCPWLGIVACPVSIYAGAPLVGVCGFTINENEMSLRVRNVKVRNFGFNSLSNPGAVQTNNGGNIDIDGVEFENCVGSSGGGVGVLRMYIGNSAFGTGPNNTVRLSLKNIRFTGCTLLSTSTGAGELFIQGNLNSYDIDKVTSDSTNSNFMYVEHCSATPPTSGYVLEYGRIANCYCNGAEFQGLVLSFSHNFTVSNSVTIEGNRLFNMNSGGSQTYYSPIYLAGNSAMTATAGKFVFRNNQFSYGAKTDYPIHIDNTFFIAASLSIDAHNNLFEEGQWKLAYAGGSPAIINSLTPFLGVNIANNGIAGDKETNGTATPTTGTWSQGDKQWRTNCAASGTVLDATTTKGTLTGPMSGCSGTGTSGTATIVYTGTPPNAGEYVTFASSATGTYRILNVNTLTTTITLGSNLNGNVANGSSGNMTYAVPTFKQLTLSS